VSFLSSLLVWANVPYVVALGVAMAFGLLQMTGLLGLLAGGADHDGDSDGDHDVDAHHDADADHDADHDADDHGVGHQLLAGLGVGKVPLSILWQTYAVVFAISGIAANAVYLTHVGAVPTAALAWTLPLSLVVGYVATRLLSRAIARLIADPAQEATSRKQLVGHTGVVISSTVSHEFGEVRLRDKTGHVVRIICRTRDEGPTIPEGREVVIVDYDGDHGHLFVAPLDADEAQPGEHRLRAP
jgi:membrane protein implicated in regulation of membrane protease activity